MLQSDVWLERKDEDEERSSSSSSSSCCSCRSIMIRMTSTLKLFYLFFLLPECVRTRERERETRKTIVDRFFLTIDLLNGKARKRRKERKTFLSFVSVRLSISKSLMLICWARRKRRIVVNLSFHFSSQLNQHSLLFCPSIRERENLLSRLHCCWWWWWWWWRREISIGNVSINRFVSLFDPTGEMRSVLVDVVLICHCHWLIWWQLSPILDRQTRRIIFLFPSQIHPSLPRRHLHSTESGWWNVSFQWNLSLFVNWFIRVMNDGDDLLRLGVVNCWNG